MIINKSIEQLIRLQKMQEWEKEIPKSKRYSSERSECIEHLPHLTTWHSRERYYASFHQFPFKCFALDVIYQNCFGFSCRDHLFCYMYIYFFASSTSIIAYCVRFHQLYCVLISVRRRLNENTLVKCTLSLYWVQWTYVGKKRKH